jgi:hypothetical protein
MECEKMEENREKKVGKFWNSDMLEDEVFGLLHRAIAYINEQREMDEQIAVLDRELGFAAKMLISRTGIRSVLNRRILDEYDDDFERFADISGGV